MLWLGNEGYLHTLTVYPSYNSTGICTKNGAHCAFAHGSGDLRTPTYDLRELQAIERGESPVDGPAIEMSTSMEKERILNDDPKWNGRSHCVDD